MTDHASEMIERLVQPSASRSPVDFFARFLVTFQASSSRFQVICTLPPRSRRSAASGHDQILTALPPSVAPSKLVILDSSFNPPTLAHLRMAKSAIRDLQEEERGHGARGIPEAIRLLLLLAINNADKAPKPAAFEQRLALMLAFAQDLQESLSQQQKDDGGLEQESRETCSLVHDSDLSIDIGVTTQPFFSDKSAAVAEAEFYKSRAESGYVLPKQVILAGYDTLIRIFNPKYYTNSMQEALGPLFKRARLRVTMRTDDEWGGREEQERYVEDILRGDGLGKIGGDSAWGARIDLVEGRKPDEDIVSSTMARQAAEAQDWERLGRLVPPEVRRWVELERPYGESA